jgi:chromosome partitioning protein
MKKIRRNNMYEQVSMEDLAKVAEDARSVLLQVHRLMAKPHPNKAPPTFASTYIAELCKIEKTQVRHLAEKHNLPTGTKIDGSKAREYSLEDTILWSRTLGNWPTRPKGKLGKAVAIVNYKGGVAKTSTAVALAQGLTLRGLKVLLVDCDGQGTATQLCGINPEQNVEEEQTIMPYIYGDQSDLLYAVQPTYWANLSIIPASSIILAAEFALPGLAVSNRGFEFWNVLKKGIEPLRKEFDAIIFDTSPSLSHLTLNSMLAADGLLMPCPPESLDFASSVQFWGLFSELVSNLQNAGEKRYDFMSVILTKVKGIDSHRLVKPWMKQAYGKYMNVLEIPESDAAKMASAQLKTVYDLRKAEGTVNAYRRYKEPLDRLCDQILDQLSASWSR